MFRVKRPGVTYESDRNLKPNLLCSNLNQNHNTKYLIIKYDSIL